MVKVLLGAPVRNRAWILPRYIDHIKRMDLRDIQLDTLFVANDCNDNSVELLLKAGFNVRRYDNLPTKTSGYVRGQYGYAHLANLRNILIDEFLRTDNEYLFSVDTDVLVPPYGLAKLIKNGKDVCSMILCNQKGTLGNRAHNIMSYVDTGDGRGYYRHVMRWSDGELIPVDLTGAVYLIHRRVLEYGIRYAYDRQGEDIPFCREAKRAGFELFCDTSLKPIHVMEPGVELIGGC